MSTLLSRVYEIKFIMGGDVEQKYYKKNYEKFQRPT